MKKKKNFWNSTRFLQKKHYDFAIYYNSRLLQDLNSGDLSQIYGCGYKDMENNYGNAKIKNCMVCFSFFLKNKYTKPILLKNCTCWLSRILIIIGDALKGSNSPSHVGFK